jgi:FkbM family methyltransferase
MTEWHQMSLKKAPRLIYLRGELSEIKSRLNSISREPWTKLWATCFKPTDCVYDIGANVGAMSLYFATYVPDGLVHAFEPSPLAYAELLANIAYNDITNIRPIQAGVGEKTGTEKFALSGDRPSDALHTWGKGEDTKVVALDDFVGPPPHHLFIDTDNYEIGVLKGAKARLATCQSVMCEFAVGNEFIGGDLLAEAGLIRFGSFHRIKNGRPSRWSQALWCRDPDRFRTIESKVTPSDRAIVFYG